VAESLNGTPEVTRADVRRVLWITLGLNVVVSAAKILVGVGRHVGTLPPMPSALPDRFVDDDEDENLDELDVEDL